MSNDVKRLFSFGCPSLEDFEKNSKRAKELGATHILITENLPPAMWQYEQTGDPYTAWFVNNPSLLKLFMPEKVKPFVDVKYAEKVVKMLKDRCEVLQKLGLKAHWFSSEPQVLPEAFYVKYPHLRGPRVDQSNRARTAHFAPCADQPEVLKMYKESVQQLLTQCPEIEIFYFLTTDSGSGFCWSNGLYPGKNGNARCKDRPMEDRVSDFLINLQDAAKQIGENMEVDLVEIAPRSWMLPTFDNPKAIVKKLPEGLAVNHMEGPDGKRFISKDRDPIWWNVFSPLVGIARPFNYVRNCVEEKKNESMRCVHTINDIENTDFLFDVLETFFETQPKTDFEIVTLLREVAEKIGGEDQADKILSLWMAIDDIEKYLGTLDFGHLFVMTSLLSRWLTRPFVPFPEELPAEQKEYYRHYMLQSKGDEQADDLVDVQAMRMFKGWGAMLLVEGILEKVEAKIQAAQSIATELGGPQWDLLNKKLEVLTCLVKNVYHAVKFQAHLDRIKPTLEENPVDENPPIGTRGGWDYEDMTNTARAEIDNCLYLKSLLESTDAPLIDFAEKQEDENVLRFGPKLKEQLKLKVDIMNEHWQDYKRLFVTPNP